MGSTRRFGTGRVALIAARVIHGEASHLISLPPRGNVIIGSPGMMRVSTAVRSE
jgi:hypothetical protein